MLRRAQLLWAPLADMAQGTDAFAGLGKLGLFASIRDLSPPGLRTRKTLQKPTIPILQGTREQRVSGLDIKGKPMNCERAFGLKAPSDP